MSMYNHQDDPNSKWDILNDKQIKLTALKDINENDEITVSYGDGYWNSRNYNKK
jgi:SET domain-containing protein